MLRHVAQHFARTPLEFARMLAEHFELAISWRERAGQHANHRRLAGSAGADDTQDRAGWHAEGDIGERLDVTIAMADVLHVHDGTLGVKHQGSPTWHVPCRMVA